MNNLALEPRIPRVFGRRSIQRDEEVCPLNQVQLEVGDPLIDPPLIECPPATAPAVVACGGNMPTQRERQVLVILENLRRDVDCHIWRYVSVSSSRVGAPSTKSFFKTPGTESLWYIGADIPVTNSRSFLCLRVAPPYDRNR